MNNLQELEDKLAAAQAIVERLKKEKEAAERANQKYELQGGDSFIHSWPNNLVNSAVTHRGTNCTNHNKSKYVVYFDHVSKKWLIDSYQNRAFFTVSSIDKPTAQKLCDDLNSGKFSLE
jgi:hypothetical protein